MLEAQEENDKELRQRLGAALAPDYELRERLGRGGFGLVYAAWDHRLEREVAVKALRPEVAGPAVLRRFEREARSAARLQHPNIVPIYQVGERDGLMFMIMPRIRGGTLRAYLAESGPISESEARRILSDLARAVAEAHRANIVHRDIKPENVLLDGPDRRVMLMDFGIAKALDPGEEGLTATGVMVGTPLYMSPEQMGGTGTIDGRADIYSLGVLAYQMLSQRLPYQASSVPALLVLQATGQPPDLRTYRPDISRDLAAIVMRCLAREPVDRWQTAESLIDALAGKVQVDDLHPDPSRRRWFVAVATITVAVVLGVTLIRNRGGEPTRGTGAAVPDSAVPPGNATFIPVPARSVPPQREKQRPPVQRAPRDTAVTVPSAPALPVTGFLTINARPYGMVSVNGVDVRLTPLTRYALTPGKYLVTVTRDGYTPWSDSIAISPGNEARRTVPLMPSP